MSYLVLARKYRPQTFGEISGQEHVSRTLINSIKREKIAHAYLFCGPRGVGKTSIARIFAKALNCEQGPTKKPCMTCNQCQEIALGKSLSVREIDGASHNSVDNVRDLIDSFKSLPPPGANYKIYIIDEVHMLSTAAFNALLKSLEEPPPNTIFILATTEPHKILATVLSRCQRFDLRALPFEEVEQCLKSIITKEKIKIQPDVLRQIARLSEGSLRDAQSLLERVIAFSEGEITSEDAGKALGVVAKPVLLDISQAVFKRDTSKLLEHVHQIFSSGMDPALFLKEFVTHWRELFIAKFAGKTGLSQIGIDADMQAELLRQVETVTTQDLQDLMELARSGADNALRSSYLKYALESLLVRMSTRMPVADLVDLLQGSNRKVVKQNQSTEKKTLKNSIAKTSVQNKSDTNLNWREFVSSISKECSPVMIQHLRKLSITAFTQGILSATGTEFSVKSLSGSDNLTKLQNFLKNYSKCDNWQISLKESGEKADTLHNEDRREELTKQASRAEELVSHPSVQAIRDIFPGSEVEKIGIKAGN